MWKLEINMQHEIKSVKIGNNQNNQGNKSDTVYIFLKLMCLFCALNTKRSLSS